jgi:hypothetical protein
MAQECKLDEDDEGLKNLRKKSIFLYMVQEGN